MLRATVLLLSHIGYQAEADKLEKATIQTIEEGVMTGDLAALSSIPNKQTVDTEAFLVAINERLAKLMQ